ncbi:MAG: hypothetical protein SOR77_00275 [Peptoniphilus sp.]|uniref:hypothetical protein n=1 Tax=Peptoniphilus sp. TaxID=1971214 RepID=UPI002A74B1F0|nr:hypothetical protein [Peptoniphilus sp.]MDY2986044.1 hypothetical protein [Peptoniphilus sp.]
MLKKIISVMFLVIFFNTNVESKVINVTVPKYNVTVNSVVMDKEKNKYPPLSYNGITYFPMTYDNAMALGILINWNNAERTLYLDRGAGFGNIPIKPFDSEKENGKLYSVKTIPFDVVINGKKIDKKELKKYPLFVFRDITYLPMTWSIFHDELDYDVSFNHKDGLVMKAALRHMSFPTTGMEEIVFDGGRVSYTSQEPLANYSIIISGENGELNLGKEIRSKYFKNFRNFQPPGVLGHYLLNPDKRVETKPYVKGYILYMPFGYASDFNVSSDGGTLTLNSNKVRNVILKYNVNTGAFIGEDEVDKDTVNKIYKN